MVMIGAITVLPPISTGTAIVMATGTTAITIRVVTAISAAIRGDAGDEPVSLPV